MNSSQRRGENDVILGPPHGSYLETLTGDEALRWKWVHPGLLPLRLPNGALIPVSEAFCRDYGVSGRVECSAAGCGEAVDVAGSFALPEEWALELDWTYDSARGQWRCSNHSADSDDEGDVA